MFYEIAMLETLPVVEQVVEHVVDQEQLFCLTNAIYHEARSETRKGKFLVGYVVDARVNDERWGDDYCSVITEPYQFSFVRRDGTFPPMYEYGAKKDARKIALEILTQPEPFDECLLYFHGESVEPNWDYSKIDVYGQFGAHIFYTDKNCK